MPELLDLKLSQNFRLKGRSSSNDRYYILCPQAATAGKDKAESSDSQDLSVSQAASPEVSAWFSSWQRQAGWPAPEPQAGSTAFLGESCQGNCRACCCCPRR